MHCVHHIVQCACDSAAALTCIGQCMCSIAAALIYIEQCNCSIGECVRCVELWLPNLRNGGRREPGVLCCEWMNFVVEFRRWSSSLNYALCKAVHALRDRTKRRTVRRTSVPGAPAGPSPIIVPNPQCTSTNWIELQSRPVPSSKVYNKTILSTSNRPWKMSNAFLDIILSIHCRRN